MDPILVAVAASGMQAWQRTPGLLGRAGNKQVKSICGGCLMEAVWSAPGGQRVVSSLGCQARGGGVSAV
jgi:hypothetical protein